MASDSPIPRIKSGLFSWLRKNPDGVDDTVTQLNKLCALEIAFCGKRFGVRFSGENAVIDLKETVLANTAALPAIPAATILGNATAAAAAPTALNVGQTRTLLGIAATDTPVFAGVTMTTGGGVFSGSAGNLTLTAVGTDKKITLAPSGLESVYIVCTPGTDHPQGLTIENATGAPIVRFTRAAASKAAIGVNEANDSLIVGTITDDLNFVLTTNKNINFSVDGAGALIQFSLRSSGAIHYKQGANSNSGGLRFIRADSSAYHTIYIGSDDAAYYDLRTSASHEFYINGTFAGSLSSSRYRLPAGYYINFGTTSGSGGYGFRDNSGTVEFKNSGGAWTAFVVGGDVVGPGSATDNAVARFDTATGKLLQNSSASLDDNGALQIVRLGVGIAVDATIPVLIKQANNSHTGSQRMIRSDNSNYIAWYIGGDDKGYFDNRAAGGWEFYGNAATRLGGFDPTDGFDAVGKIYTASTTVSSSTTTGSGVFSGGVGVALDLNVGGRVNAATARIGPAGTGSIQPLEIVGTDGGLAITATNTSAGTECYVAGFIKDSSATYRKIGALAFQWTDDDATAGYASWNVHTTRLTGGSAADYYGLAVWANAGAAFFPANIASTSAPGAGVLKVNGSLVTTAGIIASFDGGNATSDCLALRNTNAGNAATSRLKLGNNATSGAFTMQAYGSNHATLPNYASLWNEFNAPLLLGVNGVEVLRITSSGLTVAGAITTTAPSGASAHPWKLGSLVTGLSLAADLTQAVYVDINGTVYKLLTGA